MQDSLHSKAGSSSATGLSPARCAPLRLGALAHNSLAVQPLSRNDISIIANLLKHSFDYYLNHQSPFFVDYLCSLRTLVGLGFTAVLADRSLLSIYQHYLNHFIGQKEGDFRQSPEAKEMIAQSTAEMVGTAVISFRALRHPPYYGEFINSLHYTIAKIPELKDGTNDSERILSNLTVN
ncbi:MAG: hypothetical protein K2X50_09535 [Gammaproteobacteria bacterium]|nr:hypothetical protein [Gammaproteobacteria bacterium]